MNDVSLGIPVSDRGPKIGLITGRRVEEDHTPAVHEGESIPCGRPGPRIRALLSGELVGRTADGVGDPEPSCLERDPGPVG